MKPKFDNILNQEMTRREFISKLGLGVVAIFGIPTLLHVLSSKPQDSNQRNQGSAYGAGAYGE